MADDKPEDVGMAPESGRAKRTPPTIDLEATEVSTQPQDLAGEPEAQHAAEQAAHDQVTAEETKAAEVTPQPPPAEEQPPVASAPVSPWVIAPLSGAVAAALVIAVGWALGWPAVQAPPAAPQV